ncbi:MAG: bifunctional ADP-dependent NAD(P)H-hydrate dehydratase/NAD(P)H-hydrate epimerase, partial [Clostridiales bacterium]|nr:bifunctional ADP-dependent NAD(P)H-hydrate dehydratase/NAD(P)H-hydrate epimerase [Clostridiales bacterium]
MVLTPHVGEFSRLTGLDKQIIKEDSVRIAKEFSKEYNVTVVLKSSTTIITDGEFTCINVAGNSSLAKAGSGD